MKTRLLFFTVLCTITFGYSQTTYVPDDIFENYLETHTMTGQVVPIGHPNSMGNGVANDDYVFTSRIELDTHLFIQNLGISDLTGIEDFAALTNLACHDNNLTQLDFSSNLNLSELFCYRNQLTNLNVSSNSMLTKLICSENQLSNINVTNNPQLIQLSCGLNQINNLDVTQNTVLQALSCYSNLLTNIDVSQNLSLINLFCGDNQLTTVNTIVNTNLNLLGINENPITTYDVTHLPNLTLLYIFNTQIANIDLSQNVSLSVLNCNNTQLTSLDLTQNSALTYINCDDNLLLASLNVKNGNNTNITTFTTLNTPNLVCVEVDDDTYSNTNWTSIDSVNSFSENCHYNETYVPDNNFENYLETHDANGNIVAVGDANSMGNGVANDDYVTTSKISSVTQLNVFNQNISDLTGIEDFTSLENLSCGDNSIANVDLSQNLALVELDISVNFLSNLDLNSNTLLEILNCSENGIQSLDLSLHSSLVELDCSDNGLTALNVNNGNNYNVGDFVATQNQNLLCIEVDDTAYSTTNWIDIDAQTSFNTNCANPETYVPDDNFENYLETHDANGNVVAVGDASSMGNGIANDDYVTTAAINTVTDLDVNSLSIADLTGIEDFAALTQLVCRNNSLTTLNISQNTSLKDLYCQFNQISNINTTSNNLLEKLYVNNNSLTSLDLSQNNLLTHLVANTNLLTNLVVTQNTNLITFEFHSNQISTIDLSQNILITSLKTGNNLLTSLDLSNNVNLEVAQIENNQISTLSLTPNNSLVTLICNNNSLSNLNFSLFPSFQYLNCNSNQLTSLNVKNANNTNFTHFNATNNPNLTCIEVDDAAWSTANWTQIDATISFSENCHYGETYTPDDNFENYLETHDANGNVVAVGDANSMGNGIANDDYVTTAAINSVSNLNIDSQNISDLTGIEDFSALDTLICSNNQLSGIDISQNTALTFLHCNNNQLTSLDISQNVLLTYLSCTNSQLTSLDVTQNTVLETLICYSNQMASLDVSANTLLNFLNCHTNQLTTLNAKNGNNINFTVFDATYNPNLTCIEVDNAAWSTANWTNIDATSTFVNNQSECTTLSSQEFTQLNFTIYPNLINDRLNVIAQTEVIYSIVTINGQVIKEGELYIGENNINISNLSNGLYFLQVETAQGISTKKIMKQ